MRRLRTDGEVDSHPLPRAWPRAVEREVLASILGAVSLPCGIFFALRLPHAERECGVAVLAIPVVAEVEFGFARPEEIVRRRKSRNRSAGRFRGGDAIGGLQWNER